MDIMSKPTAEEVVSKQARPTHFWSRRVWQILGCVALCYIGMIIMLLFLEKMMIFHPASAAREWLPPPDPRIEDVVLQTADQIKIHAWWFPPEGWEPSQGAVLYSHGNAGNLSHRGLSIGRWQEAMEQAVLIYDYPGYGYSEGKPGEIGCYAAADASYDWLTQKLHVPSERILLYGGSLGGAVAVDLASRRPHRALVLVSPFSSIPDMAQKLYPWLPVRWLVRNRFDNLAKIGKCSQPVFVAHGTADRLIPFEQGKRLFEAANQPKRFFAMEGYDHNHTPGPEFYRALSEFLKESEATAATGSTN
jgi:fermentation-respiration switch protein FrsA (DUF1100 family)